MEVAIFVLFCFILLNNVFTWRSSK
jgi:hypothetical protein